MQDGHGVLVLLAVEDGDLLLVDLQDWSIGTGDDVVGQDLLGLGSGSLAFACGSSWIRHVDALTLGSVCKTDLEF